MEKWEKKPTKMKRNTSRRHDSYTQGGIKKQMPKGIHKD
jgi:hypothetical protein